MADKGDDEHQFISECLATLKSQQSSSAVISTHQQELVAAQQPSTLRDELQHGATNDGVDEHQLIVQYAKTLALASPTSGNAEKPSDSVVFNAGQTCDESPQVLESTVTTTTTTQVEATTATPDDDLSSSGDRIDDEHSNIGQLLTTLSSHHSQASTDTEVDERANIKSQSELSSVTSAEPAEPQSTLLQSEQRLAEQRLKVLHLLTEMSVNEPVSTIETTIDESQSSESTALETSDLQQNKQNNSIEVAHTSNSVNDDVTNDEHLLIAEHTATLAEPRLAQTAAEDTPDAVLAIEESNVETSEQSEHQLIVQFAMQLNSNSVSQLLGSSTAVDDTPDSRPVVNESNAVAYHNRQIESEHRLIVQYAEQLNRHDVSQTKEIAADETTHQVEDAANNEKRQLLEHLQAKNQSLKEKLARLKEILQARDDIDILMRVNDQLTQRMSSQQEMRIDLTTKRDEMMKQLRVRNSLWRSPTISQAGSELSIDTADDQSSSLTTPIAGGSGYFSFSTQMDDFTHSAASDDANAENRRQIQQLQEQLQQMMTSSLHDDVMKVQSQTTSSSFWSSERTMTVTAEVTSMATSKTVSIVESTTRSLEESGALEVTCDNREVDSVMPTGFATPPNSLDIPHSDSVITECT